MFALKSIMDWIQLALASNSLNGKLSVYPDLASGVTASSSAAAWSNTGAIAEVVPAGTTSEEVLVKGVIVDTVSADDDYQLNLYTGAAGSEVIVASLKFSGVSDRSIPVGMRLGEGERLSARLVSGSANVRTAKLSINYISWRA